MDINCETVIETQRAAPKLECDFTLPNSCAKFVFGFFSSLISGQNATNLAKTDAIRRFA